MANATCENERRCGWFGPTDNLRVRHSRHGLNYACPKCGEVVHVVARDWLGEADRRQVVAETFSNPPAAA